ncbi:hypothetical protein L7F22_026144 [Adiantum nelumboides]|nr:hypothetical protein [Adiantum nelumboides]
MASGKGQSNPSTSGDAGGNHNEDYGDEYGPPLPTEDELREMEHRRLVSETTNMMLNFAKDPKLAKYMTEIAFQDVHAQWKATTTSPSKPDFKKQYSEKELEEEIEARLARILCAQDKGKKHDKKRRKSIDFSGYLGSLPVTCCPVGSQICIVNLALSSTRRQGKSSKISSISSISGNSLVTGSLGGGPISKAKANAELEVADSVLEEHILSNVEKVNDDFNVETKLYEFFSKIARMDATFNNGLSEDVDYSANGSQATDLDMGYSERVHQADEPLQDTNETISAIAEQDKPRNANELMIATNNMLADAVIIEADAIIDDFLARSCPSLLHAPIAKALELFLQDLCDRTYETTLKKGAKTINLQHLKQCVSTHASFDFLKETVSIVPDLEVEASGGSDTSRQSRKATEVNSSQKVIKRARSDAFSSSGRGRGRGRSSNNESLRNGEVENNEASSTTLSPHFSEVGSNSMKSSEGEMRSADKSFETHARCPKDFDLNVELNENGEVAVKAVLQSLGTSLFLGQNQNVFQQEDDYDAEDNK